MPAAQDQTLATARKRKYWLGVFGLILLWYGITAFESLYLGYHPLARRGFTGFDFVFYPAIIVGFVFLYRWYHRCPKCGGKLRGGWWKACEKCGFKQ